MTGEQVCHGVLTEMDEEAIILDVVSFDKFKGG